MSNPIAVSVDSEKCTGCGRCVEVCPQESFEIRDGKAVIVSDISMMCGQCVAACPESAIRVTSTEYEDSEFATFDSSTNWLDFGESDTGELVRLMRSRRSCRSYMSRAVDMDILEDLIRIGTTAPSGTNSQKWTFTLVPQRSDVMAFGQLVAGFFARLNRMARSFALRTLERVFSKGVLNRYYTNHYEGVAKALREWEKDGRDMLFHGATAVIVVGSAPGASTPSEDALLATQNILLGAHTMGLGSCLVGFATAAILRDSAIRKHLQMQKGEVAHAVIALGYPDVSYCRTTIRRKVAPRIITDSKRSSPA